MENARKEILENFDEENIASVERIIQTNFQNSSNEKKAFTMLQRNSSCEVEVKQRSREKCAHMLLN